MRLENRFVVAADIDRVWSALLDLEAVARCLPGAELEGADPAGGYRGRMRVKLGAVTMEYEGVARFKDVDEARRATVVGVTGKEARGQGSVTASIASTLVVEGTGTSVVVVTEFTIVGRAAQFGRGVMVEVADRVLGEFGRRLEAHIATTGGGEGGLSGDSGGSVPTIGPPTLNPALDLGPVLITSLLKWIRSPFTRLSRRDRRSASPGGRGEQS